MSKEIKSTLLKLYNKAKENIDNTIDKEFYKLVSKARITDEYVYVIEVKPVRIIKTTIKQAISMKYFLNDVFNTLDDAKEHLLKSLNRERKHYADKLKEADEAIKRIKDMV